MEQWWAISTCYHKQGWIQLFNITANHTCIPYFVIKKSTPALINRPGVAGAVLQTASSLINFFCLQKQIIQDPKHFHICHN